MINTNFTHICIAGNNSSAMYIVCFIFHTMIYNQRKGPEAESPDKVCKGACQKLLSGFFPLRGGGVPSNSAKSAKNSYFWKNPLCSF